MGTVRERMRARLLTLFTGQPDGLTPWIVDVSDGDDAGYFGEGSAAWAVHGGMATIVAGIRALLMQTLHPGAMAGVHDWSRYRSDPLGRLSGTIRWVIVVTFASSASARAESARVARFHDRVRGSYAGPDGSSVEYSAHDTELLEWVHLAFTDAFLGCHERWPGGRPMPGGADGYVREWATAGRLTGVVDPPVTASELRERMRVLLENGTLRRDERVDDVIRFIRKPPLGPGMGPAYRVLFAGAVASLPPEFRRALGLRRSWLPVVTVTRVMLWGVGRVLGRRSTAEERATERIARLRAAGASTEPVVWVSDAANPRPAARSGS